MDKRQKSLEVKVGLFVFIGLVFIGGMVVQFGSIGQSFKKFYDLSVEFPNASGLIKGSDVQLAGARIGYVADKPAIGKNIGNVLIKLKIADGIKIPRQTIFRIDSAGLLGDKYVDVAPVYGFDPQTFDRNDPAQVWQPGETIKGSELPGFKQLMEGSQPLLLELREAVSEIKLIASSMRGGLLSEGNQKSLVETLDNLKKSSENFSLASSEARKVIDSAQNGDGLLATMINDREMAQNLKALVINLREHGVLFYRDSKPKEAKAPEPKKAKKP